MTNETNNYSDVIIIKTTKHLHVKYDYMIKFGH